MEAMHDDDLAEVGCATKWPKCPKLQNGVVRHIASVVPRILDA